MANRERPWESKGWERGTEIPGGNQGHTFLARRSAGETEEFQYVLKLLRRKDDPKRRRRFHSESEALRTLDSGSISRLIDSNTHEFANDSVELFIVTERILGKSLGDLGPPTSISSACQIIVGVLDILVKCHEIGLTHRDIKPCHVILRNESLADPVLIDFGLAYHEDLQPIGAETSLEQGVGNRFIVLPEQLHGNQKRDPRSDLTQCVGLLFFLLTGRSPGVIYDATNKKPHERNANSETVLAGTQHQIRQLKRILDVGFEHSVDSRWQSIETLRNEILVLSNSAEEGAQLSFQARLEEISNRVLSQPDNILKTRAEELLARIPIKNQECTAAIRKSSNPLIQASSTSGTVGKGEIRSQRFQVHSEIDHSKRGIFTLEFTREQSEITCYARSEPLHPQGIGQPERRKMLMRKRIGVLDPNALPLLEAFIEDAWTALIREIVE